MCEVDGVKVSVSDKPRCTIKRNPQPLSSFMFLWHSTQIFTLILFYTIPADFNYNCAGVNR